MLICAVGAVAQLGERLNGIQEVDGSTPFSSTLCAAEEDEMRSWRVFLVLTALCASLLLASGCAGRQPQGTSIESPASIERPAQSLGEEESLADKIGQVGVVLLVVGAAIGGILVPLLLL